MYHFCVYFDSYYLPRALALYNSLDALHTDFHMYVLCMDEESYTALQHLDLPYVSLYRLRELEQSNPALLATKSGRSKVEYYYTCGPSYLQFVLERQPEISLLTYLDADLFFFSDPKPIFDELRGYSVGIIEHRFTSRQEKLKRFGKFNVGWMSFRRDENGLRCLRWWAERCIDWCYDRLEGDKFADQKYLDEFPVRFPAVKIIQHKGANVAPWNVRRYPIIFQDGTILIGGEPLIFFHFHGFKTINRWLFDTNMGGYHTVPSRLVRHGIFGPYIEELRKLKRAGPVGSLRESNRTESRGYGFVMRSARRMAQLSFGILRRAYIVDYPWGSRP